MANLFPTTTNYTTINKIDSEIELKKSYVIDFENKCIKKDNFGKAAISTPFDAYRQWCFLATNTARNVYGAYTDKFGIDKFNRSLNRAAIELEYQRTITECLMTNPCTKSVYDFSFTWEGSTMYADFFVSSTFDKSFMLTANV